LFSHFPLSGHPNELGKNNFQESCHCMTGRQSVLKTRSALLRPGKQCG